MASIQRQLTDILLEVQLYEYNDVDLHRNRVTLSQGEVVVSVADLWNLIQRDDQLAKDNLKLKTHVARQETELASSIDHCHQLGTENESLKREIVLLKSELDNTDRTIFKKANEKESSQEE